MELHVAAQVILDFSEKLDFSELSRRDLAWSRNLIEALKDRWDWRMLSANGWLRLSLVAGYVRRSPQTKKSRTWRAFQFGVADGVRTHDNWNHNPGLYR